MQVNIAIMWAFIKLRKVLESNRELARRFGELETRVDQHDEKISEIIEAIRRSSLRLPGTRRNRLPRSRNLLHAVPCAEEVAGRFTQSFLP